MAAANETSDEWQKLLEVVLARLERDYGIGAIMRLSDDIPRNIEVLSASSLSPDPALGIDKPEATDRLESQIRKNKPAKRKRRPAACWRGLTNPAINISADDFTEG